jgi:hypothetical protein
MSYAEDVRRMCAAIGTAKRERIQNRQVLAAETAAFMKSMARERSDWGGALRNKLHTERQESSRALQAFLTATESARHEAGAALRADLQATTATRRQTVATTLADAQKERRESSQAIRTSLKEERDERARSVNELLADRRVNRQAAQAAWLEVYRIGTVSPGAVAPEMIEEFDAAEDETEESEAEVREKILAFVNSRPEGVKLTDIEDEFGLVRIRAGVLTKELTDFGRIAKEGLLYIPVRNADTHE